MTDRTGLPLELDEVTAVTVTRGYDLPKTIFPLGVTWDLDELPDFGSLTLFVALHQFPRTPVVYVQRPELRVPADCQRRLVDAYEDGVLVALDPADPLGGGALLDRGLPLEVFAGRDPEDPDFQATAARDFIRAVKVKLT